MTGLVPITDVGELKGAAVSPSMIPHWAVSLARGMVGPSSQPLTRETQERLFEKAIQESQPGIFVCYRREDAQGFARSVYDRLAGKYGSEIVFRDVDSVPVGVEFPDWITRKLLKSRIMIVLIGREWLGMLDEHKRRRLDLADDWVRNEIQSALVLHIPIIPVLLQGVRMPSRNELPSAIQRLADFEPAEVTDSRWNYDMGELIKGIDHLMALPIY